LQKRTSVFFNGIKTVQETDFSQNGVQTASRLSDRICKAVKEITK
jgi:hypothetical protein